MIDKESNTTPDRDNWSEIYQVAENYQQQQQWQQAAVAFKRAIALRSDFFWSYHHLGDVLVQLKQWQQASVAYSRAVNIDPDFFWSWHNLGDALTNLQQWDKARIAYSRAVAIDPDFFWSWHNLGDALTKLQQWDRAIATYLQAIQLQLENLVVCQKLGTVFKQRGSLEESIQHYRQLIQIPHIEGIFHHLQVHPESLLNIADTLVERHQTNGAIVLYYMALEISPNQTQTLLRLADLLQQHNQLQNNIASHQQGLQSELLARQNTNPAVKPKVNHIPGQITLKRDRLISPDKLEDLCSAVGWNRRPLDKVKQSLDNSFCCVSAWHLHQEKQQLIGFARAVSDGAFHAVLLDIAVHPDFQNLGLGKKIVLALIQQLQQSNIKDITLFASPHIADFYHKIGFVSQPNNLELMLWSGNP